MTTSSEQPKPVHPHPCPVCWVCLFALGLIVGIGVGAWIENGAWTKAYHQHQEARP